MCPNDNSAMQTLDRDGVQFDMCPACRGVWLDRGELEKLMESAAQDGRASAPAPQAQPLAQPQAYAPPPQPQPQPQPWGGARPYGDDRGYRDDRRRDDDDYRYKKKKRDSIFDIFD
jgi:Zn-finger nucleic acid-binding protein